MSKAIAGGLLRGIGLGMVEQAEDKRLAALERAKELARTEERRYQEGRDDARFEQSKGLLHRTQVDPQGNVMGITRGGESFDTGADAAMKEGEAPGSMSAADKRIWDLAKSRYTTEEFGTSKTDWNKVAEALRSQGRDDLAGLADPSGGKGGTTIDVSSDEFLEAQRMADDWVSSQAGFFSLDKSDFGDYGGNREEARQAKTMEFYQQLTGTKAPAAGSASSPKTDGKKPVGSGTQADPYQATSQADVDWFKQSAPAGSVIMVDGKLYRK